MKSKLELYSVNGNEFIRNTNKKDKYYSHKYIERIAGRSLKNGISHILRNWKYARISGKGSWSDVL